MARKKRRGPGGGRPRPTSGRYTPPTNVPRAFPPDDPPPPPGWVSFNDNLDDPRFPVTLNLDSGSVMVPFAMANWLTASQELTAAFDQHLGDLRTRQVHGDAYTPFAQDHEAPADVLEAIAGYGDFMDRHYGT